jgi:hypothetical protein
LLAKSNRQNTIDRAASQQFVSTMADPTIIILGSPSTDASPYPAAIAFAIFSLLTSLLITPTCIWHTRHRNVGATTVTVLAILANLMNFANALIWPHDDVSRVPSRVVLHPPEARCGAGYAQDGVGDERNEGATRVCD